MCWRWVEQSELITSLIIVVLITVDIPKTKEILEWETVKKIWKNLTLTEITGFPDGISLRVYKLSKL